MDFYGIILNNSPDIQFGAWKFAYDTPTSEKRVKDEREKEIRDRNMTDRQTDRQYTEQVWKLTRETDTSNCSQGFR